MAYNRDAQPRVCECCGEAKTTKHYSWNQKSMRYASHCKDCGVWLTLFRKVFGPVTYPEKARKRQREYERAKYWANKPTARAARDLYAAFGIGFPHA